MAKLRLDETLQVFGVNEHPQEIGPVVYGDRWHVNNLILDMQTAEHVPPRVKIYRNFVEPRNIIMVCDAWDHLNKTVIVDVDLTAGEKIVMTIKHNDPGALTTLHIMGDRYLAMAGYNDQFTMYQGF